MRILFFQCFGYFNRDSDGCADHRVVAHTDKSHHSTWAGTELLPANWASECILPIVSVRP